MIELARRRQTKYVDKIEFCVADATRKESLMALKKEPAIHESGI